MLSSEEGEELFFAEGFFVREVVNCDQQDQIYKSFLIDGDVIVIFLREDAEIVDIAVQVFYFFRSESLICGPDSKFFYILNKKWHKKTNHDFDICVFSQIGDLGVRVDRFVKGIVNLCDNLLFLDRIHQKTQKSRKIEIDCFIFFDLLGDMFGLASVLLCFGYGFF